MKYEQLLPPSSSSKPSRRRNLIPIFAIATIAAILAINTLYQSPSSAQINISLKDKRDLFDQWKLKHKQDFSSPTENEYRFEVFLSALEYIENHNSQNHSSVLGLTQFAATTIEEFKAMRTSKLPKNDDSTPMVTLEPSTPLPSTWDWRVQGFVSTIVDQGQCDAVWAYAAIDCLETHYAQTEDQNLTFSAQQIMDCDQNGEGCNGGTPQSAFQYAAQYGLQTEETYPYKGGNGENFKCKYNASEAIKGLCTGSVNLAKKSSIVLQTAVYTNPAIVNIEGAAPDFMFYTSGVIGKTCKVQLADIDHSLAVVGWVQMNGEGAYILKNQWGWEWGDNGYAYISMNSEINNGLGACGLFSSPLMGVY